MITIYSTIHEFLVYWNGPVASPHFTDRMRTDRSRYIRKYFDPCLGSIRLDEFSVEHVWKLRRRLSDDPDTSETMSFIVLRIFKQAMNYAKERLLIKDSFCDSIYLPYILDSKVRIYSPKEISAIFSAVEYELLCNYYKLIFYTGLTSSEARALRLTDIDIPNRMLHIRQRIYGKCRTGHYIEALTDQQQIRDIYLSNAALACTEDELLRNRDRRSKPFWKDTGENLLFTYRNGSPISDTYLAQTRKVVEMITSISYFNTLALRYTAADAALKAGATEKDIQDFLGFTSLRYTYRMKHKLIGGHHGNPSGR